MQFLKNLTLLLILLGCTNLSLATEATEFTDPNRPIVVEKSQPTFKIRLASNITTGYAWFLQSNYNSNIVPSSHIYQKPNQTMPGAPGYEEWEFKLQPNAFTVPQTMDLTLSYARPWDLEEAKHVTIKIFTH